MVVPRAGSTNTHRTSGVQAVAAETVDAVDVDKPVGMVSSHRASGHVRMGEDRGGRNCNHRRQMRNRRCRDV